MPNLCALKMPKSRAASRALAFLAAVRFLLPWEIWNWYMKLQNPQIGTSRWAGDKGHQHQNTSRKMLASSILLPTPPPLHRQAHLLPHSSSSLVPIRSHSRSTMGLRHASHSCLAGLVVPQVCPCPCPRSLLDHLLFPTHQQIFLPCHAPSTVLQHYLLIRTMNSQEERRTELSSILSLYGRKLREFESSAPLPTGYS